MSSREWSFSQLKGLTISFCVILSIIVLVLLHAKLVSEQNLIKHEVNNGTNQVVKVEKLRRLPQVIIIGARKSGTRALLKFLELNPAIKGAKNEVHYFDKMQNYKLGLEWYRGNMPETTSDELTVEKSPAYFVTHEAPERIKAMNSSIKLILILRNPVIRLISDFSQIIANKIEHANGSLVSHEYEDGSYYYDSPGLNSTNGTTNFDDAWQDAVKKFEDFVLRPDGGIDEQRSSVRIGMYSMHLERWLAHFPRRNIHIVDGERLIENPFEVMHSLELFLNLKPEIKPDHFVFNPQKGFFCIAREKLLSPNDTLDRAKRMISEANRGAMGSICLSRSKGRRHVQVKEELINSLSNFYEPYNEYLGSLTGVKFIWINKK